MAAKSYQFELLLARELLQLLAAEGLRDAVLTALVGTEIEATALGLESCSGGGSGRCIVRGRTPAQLLVDCGCKHMAMDSQTVLEALGFQGLLTTAHKLLVGQTPLGD